MQNAWLHKLLCSRYTFAEFKTLQLPIRNGDMVKRVAWRWALGLFRRGEYEVLGAWAAELPPAQVVRDLHERGLEQIKVVSMEVGMASSSEHPDALPWPPAETHLTSPVSSAAGFGPRRQAAFQSAMTTAQHLQLSLKRAIQRRAPFADEASAVAFLAQSLERADRRFYATPKPRLSGSGPDRLLRFSGGQL